MKAVSEEMASMKCRWVTGGTVPQLLMHPRVDVGETNITLSEGSPAMRDHFSYLDERLKLIVTSTLKMPTLSTTAASKENAW